jgi:hypothetical protein
MRKVGLGTCKCEWGHRDLGVDTAGLTGEFPLLQTLLHCHILKYSEADILSPLHRRTTIFDMRNTLPSLCTLSANPISSLRRIILCH